RELVLDRKVPRLHAADFETWREGSLHEYRLDELDAARWRVVRRGERRERALASSGREHAPGIGKWNRGATGDNRAARGCRLKVKCRRERRCVGGVIVERHFEGRGKRAEGRPDGSVPQELRLPRNRDSRRNHR